MLARRWPASLLRRVAGPASALAAFVLAVLAVPGRTEALVDPATSYDGSYLVSWTDPSGTNGVTAKLAQSLNGGAWTTASVTGTYSKSFSGMANGTYAYKIQVFEYDAELRRTFLSYESGLGAVLVTTLTAPTAPGALSGPASSGTGSYTISWGAATPVVTRYELQENGTLVYSGTALSAALTGKKDGTFTYRARACNSAGCGPYTADLLVTVELSLSAIVPDAPLVSPAVPAQGMVGALAGTPSADGGAAGYRIEIEVPPGRAGVQPKVALSYSSKGGNGVAGVGWSLSAASTIYRCPKTLELDGASRPVQLDSEDRLCIDGQRLVLVNGVHGAAGAQYVTETDPYDRITLSGAFSSSGTFIEVEHKSGRVSRYSAFSANWTTPSTWYRTLEWDRQGNCQSYVYGVFSTPGGGADTEYVLSGIAYTGTGGAACTHAIASARRVTFSYTADREDKRTTYAAGQATILTARLASITTWVGQTPVLQYVLGYDTSQATRRSLLTTVTKCAGAGCAAGQLPPTRFEYRQDAPFSAGAFTNFRDPVTG